MSFFDEVGKKITDVSQETIQKTKNMADTAKMNSAIAEEEQKIKLASEQIGRIYVQKYRENPEPEFADYVKQVIIAEQKIAELKHTIQELKGMVSCPQCRAMVDKEAMFCPLCGSAMPKKVQPVVTSYCTSCGAAIVAGQKFCVSCGTPVNTGEMQQSEGREASETEA
ncbi:MAG: zinc ribbon domain-containing protein [Lachnospiraceae bacterium]|nr:zinc ribbon domain-containing protein [Agathobacter sp.]MDD6291942.1 zinc ribbon domain-containing protein [Lachnospiraceae bacterium]